MAEERERRKIALGLHDQIGQTLALVKAELAELTPANPTVAKRVRHYLDEAIHSVRSITFELSSPVLYELGLGPAIESLGESMVERNDIGFHFEAGDRPLSLTEKTKIGLFRIVRELLFNAVKHSRASNVTVSMRQRGRRLVIMVQDDGVGFDSTEAGAKVSPAGGFGLFSIHEQMEHIGGRFEIESAPDEGTRAVVVVTPSKTKHR